MVKRNKVVYDSNKRNVNNDNNNSSEQINDVDIDFAITQVKQLAENEKNLQATYYHTLPSKESEISVICCWSSRTTQSQHGRKEAISSSVAPYYLELRNQKRLRKG